jgi:hypothetical protein
MLSLEVMEIDGVDIPDFVKDPKTLTMSPSKARVKVWTKKCGNEHTNTNVRSGPLIRQNNRTTLYIA